LQPPHVILVHGDANEMVSNAYGYAV